MIALCPNCLRNTHHEPYQSELFRDDVFRCSNCLIIVESTQTVLGAYTV